MNKPLRLNFFAASFLLIALTNATIAAAQPAPTNTCVGFNATIGGNCKPLTNSVTGLFKRNTALGANTLFSNTTGDFNTASGANALLSNTTGRGNTASGASALISNTTGIGNTASGVSALFRNTTGLFNTASGGLALTSNTTGSSNTAS